jgi:ribonuclease G
VSREILVHIGPGETQAAIIQDGHLDDFHLEVDHHQSILGNIYKGKVESILPSINGAFINIGQEKNGFLYLTDVVAPQTADEPAGPMKIIKKIFSRGEKKDPAAESKAIPLKVGQEILVQVVKEPFSTKGARLTSHISLAGRFVVYMPYDTHGGVSKKIESHDERQRLRGLLDGFDFVSTGGFIVRTASHEKGNHELTRDARFLYKIWQSILKKAETKQAPSLIYKDYDLIWKIVRDYFTNHVDKLIIDSEEEYTKIRKFVLDLIGKETVEKVHLYNESVPLFESKGVAKELQKIYDTKVMLKSGAYIIIEPTEALTVVDVNSGKFKTRASPEEAAFMVNSEAATEIARQLRLRDMGGIIVIDFIDMTREGHKRKIIETLEQELARDYAKTEVNRISPLGLVEMTRARTGKTLEAISFDPCPYCDGRGKMRIE